MATPQRGAEKEKVIARATLGRLTQSRSLAVTLKVTTLNQVPAAGWSHTLITYVNPLLSSTFAAFEQDGFVAAYQRGLDPAFPFLAYRLWIPGGIDDEIVPIV